jgi:hypothetical protein
MAVRDAIYVETDDARMLRLSHGDGMLHPLEGFDNIAGLRLAKFCMTMMLDSLSSPWQKRAIYRLGLHSYVRGWPVRPCQDYPRWAAKKPRPCAAVYKSNKPFCPTLSWATGVARCRLDFCRRPLKMRSRESTEFWLPPRFRPDASISIFQRKRCRGSEMRTDTTDFLMEGSTAARH